MTASQAKALRVKSVAAKTLAAYCEYCAGI
jgi:hypothetical protein